MSSETTFLNRFVFALLCVIVVFSTLAYGAVHQPIIAFVYLLIALVIVIWAVDSLRRGAVRVNRSFLQIPILLTVIYALFQVIPFGSLASQAGLEGIRRTISIEPFWTQMFALHFFALFLYFAAMLASIDSVARIRRLSSVLIVFGFLFSFYAILQYVLSPTKIYGLYDAQHAAQPFGSFVNRHNYAALIEMLIAVPLGMLFTGSIAREKRLIVITAVLLMGVSLILSGSRGGLLALVSSLVFLVIVTGRAKSGNQIAVKVALAALLLVIVVFGSIFVGGESSLTRIAETAKSDDFSANRFHIWKVTLDVIVANLPFGAGIGAYAAAYTQFDTMNGMGRVEQAHNDYLQILADAGVVGLILGIAFIGGFFRIGMKSVRTDNVYRRGIALGAMTGCFSILVHSIFDFVLHTTAISLTFLTLLTLVVAAGREYDDDERVFERKRRKANVTSIEAKRKRED